MDRERDERATTTITYGKSAPDDCGANVPGNWGVLDFDGGANSSNDTKDWIEFGYPGLVTAPGTSPGDPGAFSNGLGAALDTLKTSGRSSSSRSTTQPVTTATTPTST